MGLRAKIEAILFLHAKPLTAPDLATQANADLDDVRAALSQLVQDYESREDSGIAIDTSDGYMMVVKEDYENLSQDILEIELKTGCLRTLSVVAMKEPIYQAELVEMRGGGAYEHIKELVDMGLVKKYNEGHKHVLRTTPLFKEYFRLTDNGIELQTVLKKHGDKIKFTRGAEDSEIEPDGSSLQAEGEAIHNNADMDRHAAIAVRDDSDVVASGDSKIEPDGSILCSQPKEELSELKQLANQISEELSEVAVEHAL